MKFSKEVIVGLLGAIIIYVVLASFNYIRRKNFITRDIVFTATFEDTKGLLPTQPVKIQGRTIGEVTDIWQDEHNGPITVEMKIKGDIQAPKNAIAVIQNPSLVAFGPNEVYLKYAEACYEGCLESGDHIEGRLAGFEDLLPGGTAMMKKIDPIVQKLSNTDSLAAMIMDMKAASSKANAKIAQSLYSLQEMSVKAESMTANFKKQNGKITGMLDTLSANIAGFRKMNVGKLMTNAQKGMSKIDTMLAKTDGQIEKLDSTIDKASASIEKLVNNEKFQKLVNDETFPDSLFMQVEYIHCIIRDMRINPRRYLVLGAKRKAKQGKGPCISPKAN